MQLAAYAANIALVVAAWRLPRLRTYAIVLLIADVIRFVAGLVPLYHDASTHDLVLYGIDGTLALAPLGALAWAMKGETFPVTALSTMTLTIALLDLAAGNPGDAARAYLACFATVHAFVLVGHLLTSQRRKRDLETWGLLTLTATGLSGTIVVVTWDNWELVNAGNVLTHCILSIATFVLVRRDNTRNLIV